jgi:sugar-specific transcriptional regulator TrmB
MEPKEVINILKEFGLGEYEAKAYLALLERGKISARIVSEVTRIPYTKIYQVLQNLERFGFIISVSGKPRRHMAVSPKKALKKRMMQIEKEHEKENKKRETLKEKLVKELGSVFKDIGEEEIGEGGTWTIVGSVNVNSYIKSLFDNAKALRCTLSDLESFVGNYKNEIKNTKAEILVRAPNGYSVENVSVFNYAEYEGSDVIIKDDSEVLYTFFVASPGVFTFSESKVRVIVDKKLVSGLIKDFDLSLGLLEEVKE